MTEIAPSPSSMQIAAIQSGSATAATIPVSRMPTIETASRPEIRSATDDR
jgi:hypothetical protein